MSTQTVTQARTRRGQQQQQPAQSWNTNFDTVKRQRLFRDPPSKETAYPTLAKAVAPHVDSFNEIFAENGQLHHALRDIGIKTFFDGNPLEVDPDTRRNKLEVRVREIFLERSMLPTANKIDKKREIFPAECRERHVSYRGRLRGRFECRVNGGEWKESIREFGQLPIMLRVSRCVCRGHYVF